MSKFEPLFSNFIPKSPYEELCKEGFRRFNLKPEQNYKVGYFYIDFAFPDKMIGLEVDSQKWHTDIERDKRRHAYLESKGWKIYHFHTKLIHTNPRLPAAFVYIKHVHNNDDLMKLANFEILKVTRFRMTDEQITSSMDRILS